MEYTELISVIIPIYKVENYLDKCIQSVVEQTYKNLEIILVDDGSPDNCPEICESWRKKDSRIKVIHKSNGGLSDARNAGMSIATGSYMGFVDSDDYIDKTMYENLYKAIKAEDADIAICDYAIVKENGESFVVQSPMQNECFTGLVGLEKIAGHYGWHYITVWNKLYRKDIWNGIEFPVGKIHEDEFVIHEIFFRCKKIATISEKLYKYLQRDGSITKQKISVKNLDIVEALYTRSNFYKQKGLTELNRELLSSIKSVYDSRRMQIQIISDKKEKRRLREIDKIFRKIYFSDENNVSFIDRMKYTFPMIGFQLCRKKKEKKLRKNIKVYLKKIVIAFFSKLPRKAWDCLKKRLPINFCNNIDKERIRQFGLKLIENPDKCYKEIISNHKIMEICEGSYSYDYFNMCYLNNVINLILYALYEGCIPVIKINDNQIECNKWSWYFKQPVDIICENSYLGDNCKSVKCNIRESLFKISFEDGFYPYSKNYPIWSYLNKTFVVFNNETKAYIEQEKKNLLNQKTLGVLLRGTDYTSLRPKGHPVQPEVHKIIEQVKVFIEGKNYKKLYVATEEKRLFEKIVAAFGSENVLSNSRTYYDEQYYNAKHDYIGEVHFERENDNYLKGLEYLSSITILSACDGLVSGNCGGSMYALLRSTDYTDICIFNEGYYQ